MLRRADMRLSLVLLVLALAAACGSRSGELPPFDRDAGAKDGGGDAGGNGGSGGGP
jgi:hypothetical protein